MSEVRPLPQYRAKLADEPTRDFHGETVSSVVVLSTQAGYCPYLRVTNVGSTTCYAHIYDSTAPKAPGLKPDFGPVILAAGASVPVYVGYFRLGLVVACSSSLRTLTLAGDLFVDVEFI